MSQNHLTNLPLEIIQHIAGYLDIDDIENLRKSSNYIDCCLSDNFFWRNLAQSRIRPTFPPYNPDILKFDWQANVPKYLHERQYWDRSEASIRVGQATGIHTDAVHAVMITQDGEYCLTAGRDRKLTLWHLESLFNSSSPPPTVCNIESHRGWIWNLHQTDANIYSASFDKTVKIWDLNRNLALTKIIKLEVPVLAITSLDSYTICMGLQNGVLAFADSRAPETYDLISAHHRPILSIVSHDYITISCSEDYNITIVDRRKPSTILRQVPYLQSFGTPLKLSLCEYYLLVAGLDGDVHFFDSNSFAYKGLLNVTNGTNSKITGLCHCMGTIIVATVAGDIKQYSLTKPPKLIRCMSVDGVPLSLHYCNQIIAVGTSQSTCVVMTHENHSFVSTPFYN